MRTLGLVDPTAAAVLGAILGLAIGAALMASTRRPDGRTGSRHPGERRDAQRDEKRSAQRGEQRGVPQPSDPRALPPGVSAVLAVLPSGAIVLDAADAVVSASPWAVAHGLIRDDNLVHAELRRLARQVRRDGGISEVELDLPRGSLGRGRMTVGARVAPLGDAFVLLLVDDHTKARRVEEVRRDFVVNVSHELKTPVGGMALLAEAVLDARDDPEAVARFARRMQVEGRRLTGLVQEIVDLSRLQIADALQTPELVDVGSAATAAIEQSRVVAEARDVELVPSLTPGVQVVGDPNLLATAIRNLVGNAVHYSEPGTRVAVSVRTDDGLVEIAVTDQGPGIHESEQARIFERFYRIDAARSRDTGGTGLGLAIVKHICANHGGEVTVWSEEGHGSTFTMRLPAAPAAEDEGDAPVIPPGPSQSQSQSQSQGPDHRTREVTR